jgi:hypothetical protein
VKAKPNSTVEKATAIELTRRRVVTLIRTPPTLSPWGANPTCLPDNDF